MDSEVKELISKFEKVTSEEEYNQANIDSFFNDMEFDAKSMPLTIDDEFEELIPKISPVEYKLLNENILNEGVRDRIVIWKTEDKKIIIDGHNRYKICLKHNLKYKIQPKFFKTREEAIGYIIKNQLGRRNLTPGQKRYLIGKQYNLEKKAPHRPEKKKGEGGKKHHLNTDKKIAREYKVSPKYVRNAANYSKNIDIIGKNIGSKNKDKILSNDFNMTNNRVNELAKLDPEKQKKVLKLAEDYRVDDIGKGISSVIKEESEKEFRKNVEIYNPRIFNGNCDEWLRRLKDKSYDLLITSPPSKEDVTELKSFVEKWVPLALSKIEDTGSAYIFTSSKPEEIKVYLDVLLNLSSYDILHFELVNILSWHYGTRSKRIPEQTQKSNWQPIFHLIGKNAKNKESPNTAKIFSLDSIDISEIGNIPPHYFFQIPNELARNVIKFSIKSPKNWDRVIVPFAGTGTFLSVCAGFDVLSKGCEENDEICKIAEKNGCKIID